MFRPSALPPRAPLRSRLLRSIPRAVLALSLPAVGAAVVLEEMPSGRAGRVEDAGPVTALGTPAEADPPHARPRATEPRPAPRARRPDPPSERTVTVTVGGARDTWTTSAGRVGDVLTELGLDPDPHDQVAPDLNEPLVNGVEIVIRRVDVVERSEREVIPAGVVERRTDERAAGERVVVRQGRDGWRERVEEVRLVDGREVSREVAREVVEGPVDRVVEVGIRPEPEPEPADGPEPEPETAEAPSGPVDDAVWERLAQCESGGDWSAVSDDGYSGGLQIHPETWVAHGGRAFAEHAHEATREEQILVGERIRQAQGWGAWPACAEQVGLG